MGKFGQGHLPARILSVARSSYGRVLKAAGKLGIQTVADQVVQASLKAVLEPIFDGGLSPCFSRGLISATRRAKRGRPRAV